MKYFIPTLAIVVIGALACLALIKNVDGILLSGALVIIAGIAGYTAPHRKKPS